MFSVAEWLLMSFAMGKAIGAGRALSAQLRSIDRSLAPAPSKTQSSYLDCSLVSASWMTFQCHKQTSALAISLLAPAVQRLATNSPYWMEKNKQFAGVNSELKTTSLLVPLTECFHILNGKYNQSLGFVTPRISILYANYDW